MAESEEEIKSFSKNVKEESEKVVLKLNKILFWGAPKSLQMVTAAMKLKDTCFLEEKLWPT